MRKATRMNQNSPDVFVHCVLDGRRELEELLHERLLR